MYNLFSGYKLESKGYIISLYLVIIMDFFCLKAIHANTYSMCPIRFTSVENLKT